MGSNDEYAHLNNDGGFIGDDDKGLASGDVWKTRNDSYRFGAKKKNNPGMWGNTTLPKDNGGWGETKEDTQSGGWETSASIETNSGWGEESGSGRGWDKGTHQKSDDGWGEKGDKQDISWRWRQGTDGDTTFDMGWGKEEERRSWKKGIKKEGSQIGRGRSMQEEEKGWGSSFFKEDVGGWGDRTCKGLARKKCVSVPGAWERNSQGGGIQNGWGGRISQEINDGWGGNKSAPRKWERGSQEEATRNGTGRSTHQGNDFGWGEGKSTAGGLKGTLNKEGTQEVWGSIIDQANNGGWEKDKTACECGWEGGAQHRDTKEGWGTDLHQDNSGGVGEDQGAAIGFGKKKEISSGGLERETNEEGTQNGWESSVPQESTGGWGEDKKGNDGGWGEDKGAAGGWEKRKEVSCSGKDGSAAGGWGKKEEVSALDGWTREAKEEVSQNGWESSVPQETTCGWGDDKGATDGWEVSASGEVRSAACRLGKKEEVSALSGWECEAKEEGTENEWKSSVPQGTSGGWGKDKRGNDGGLGEDKCAAGGWEKKKEVSASDKEESAACGWGKKEKLSAPGGWEREEKDEVTQNGWESSGPQETVCGYGEDKGAIDGWEVSASRKGKSAAGGWERKGEISAYEWEAKEEGTQNGWESSLPQETTGGWREDKRGNHGGWGEDKGATGEWGKKKEVSASGKEKSAARGWEKKEEVTAPGGWEREAKEEGAQSGWESCVPQAATCGWGEDEGATGEWGKKKEVTAPGGEKGAACGWEKKEEVTAPGGWEREAKEEGAQSGWESCVPQVATCGWGEDEGATGEWGKKKEVTAPGGWESEAKEEGAQSGWESCVPQVATCGWGEDEGALGGWDGGNKPDEGAKDGWERSINKGNDGGWGDDKGGWGQKKGVCASGGTKRGSQYEGTRNGWQSSIPKINSGGWGEDKGAPGRWKSSLHQGNSEEDRNVAGGWDKPKEISASSGWEWGAHVGGSKNGWGRSVHQKNEEKGVSGGWAKHTQTEDTSMRSESSTLWKANAGWGKEKHATANGWGEERKAVSSRWSEGTQRPAASGWGGKNFDPGRWRNDTWKERANSRGRPNNCNSGWGKRMDGTTGGWGQSTQQKVDDGWGRSIGKKVESCWAKGKDFSCSGWEEEKGGGTCEKIGDCWGGEQGAPVPGGWETAAQEEVDNGWGSSIEKRIDARWGENSGAQGSGDKRGECQESMREKHASSGWGNESGVSLREWKAIDNVDSASQQKGVTSCNPGEDRTEEKTSESDKAREGAVAGWEQTTCEEVDGGWEEKARDGWGETVQKDIDMGWGKDTDSATCEWKEKGNNSSGWGKGTKENGSNIGWGNKINAGRWEKGTQKDTHNGWESRMPAESNAGWGEATTEGTSGGGDGWGECSIENNTNSGWGSTHTSKGNNDKVPQSNPHFCDEQTVSMDDSNGWNCTSKKGNGWEPSTQEENPRNRHSGRSAFDWSENADADKRRSGTFGPSGSNTVPLGNRKGISKGSETNDWDQGPNYNGSSNQLNNQRASKRFNTGYGSNSWRDSVWSSPLNHNRRPRLRALISLPEYVEMDELYKTTNKILHHSGYQPGDRLNPDDAAFVLDEVLAHHREKEAKLGCGVDYIMIDSHADHQVNCFWVVRTDGSKTDFSYWKCLEHLFEVKYPQAAKEAFKGGQDGCVVIDSLEVKVKDSKEEANDFVTQLGERS
ncbi:hypothetical protein GOP47_0023389 [Adiantum capillus-veneris]|uniref:Uncharacterized protein n=1 Tax=Adiantum capillus-veneris TaxID=13818 RepID=A0A9D4U5K4_ADICA|nr:hypothetical protein GOP47_0023389 [Adiantum capillus-veneris]